MGETHILWIRTWLDSCTQRHVVSSLVSKSTTVKSGVSQGSVLGPALLSIFVTDRESEIENTLSKFANNTKLGGEGRIAVHRELDSLERWHCANLLKLNKTRYKALYTVWGTPKCKYRLDGECRLGTALGRRTCGCWWMKSLMWPGNGN